MLHTTRWQPDTCGCTIDYTWDDAEQLGTRTLTPVEIDCCVVHDGLSLLAAWEVVRAENRRKNEAVNAAAEAAGCGPDEIAWHMKAGREFVAEYVKKE